MYVLLGLQSMDFVSSDSSLLESGLFLGNLQASLSSQLHYFFIYRCQCSIAVEYAAMGSRDHFVVWLCGWCCGLP